MLRPGSERRSPLIAALQQPSPAAASPTELKDLFSPSHAAQGSECGTILTMNAIPVPRRAATQTVWVPDLIALRDLLRQARAQGQGVVSGSRTPDGGVEITLTL
jgi:hypothetical protein